MTLALECIEAMASVPEINTPERVMANKQRALRLLRTLRDKGPSEGMVEAMARAIFDGAVGLKHWENAYWRAEREGCCDSARAAYAAYIAELIREIEEER